MAIKANDQKKELTFNEFVAEQLKKETRVKNVLSIALQDVYLFLGRLANPSGPEHERVDKLVNAILLARAKDNDPSTIEEGEMNRQKDEAIRTLFIFELMRQYTNFKRDSI